MKMNKQTLLATAAVAGLISLSAAPAMANEHHEGDGQCWGANACKGKGACHSTEHECAGKNSCKGKGWLKMDKAKCDALAKKDKKIKWEAMAEHDDHED